MDVNGTFHPKTPLWTSENSASPCEWQQWGFSPESAAGQYDALSTQGNWVSGDVSSGGSGGWQKALDGELRLYDYPRGIYTAGNPGGAGACKDSCNCFTVQTRQLSCGTVARCILKSDCVFDKTVLNNHQTRAESAQTAAVNSLLAANGTGGTQGQNAIGQPGCAAQQFN
jgi:hypothetical protein